jgi:hypothetical protein
MTSTHQHRNGQQPNSNIRGSAMKQPLRPPQSRQQQQFPTPQEDVPDLLIDIPLATPTKPSMLWSAICRDATILVEANHQVNGDHDQQPSSKEVLEASRVLLQKPPTPGWEYATFGRRNGSTKLKGMKFHVYDHCGLGACDVSSSTGGHHHHHRDSPERNDNQNEEYDRRRRFVLEQHDAVTNFQHHQARMEEMDSVMAAISPGGLTVWSFACIYDPSIVETDQARAFLERIVTDTEIFRQPTILPATDESNDPRSISNNNQSNGTTPFDKSYNGNAQNQNPPPSPEELWRYGSDHALQDGFASMLLVRMDEVSYLGKLAVCHKRLNSLKNVMARNIELILERDVKLERMNEKSAELNEMAKVFAKRSKDVKRRMMWNNAMHGAYLGAAITAGLAIVAVPVIVLL